MNYLNNFKNKKVMYKIKFVRNADAEGVMWCLPITFDDYNQAMTYGNMRWGKPDRNIYWWIN